MSWPLFTTMLVLVTSLMVAMTAVDDLQSPAHTSEVQLVPPGSIPAPSVTPAAVWSLATFS